MNTIWIEVYRDTIEEHDEDDNLSAILVTEDFAEKYFNECIATNYDEAIVFGDWITDQIADETEDFYQYAKAHDAIIEIRNC